MPSIAFRTPTLSHLLRKEETKYDPFTMMAPGSVAVLGADGQVTIVQGAENAPLSLWGDERRLANLQASRINVPILQYASEAAVEITLARMLVAASGGRVTDVADWAHLPDQYGGLLGGQRPWGVIVHPRTAVEMVESLYRRFPNMMPAPTQSGLGSYMHAEIVSSSILPEGHAVFCSEQPIGSYIVLDSGRAPIIGTSMNEALEGHPVQVNQTGSMVFSSLPVREGGQRSPVGMTAYSGSSTTMTYRARRHLVAGMPVTIEDVDAGPEPNRYTRPLRAGLALAASSLHLVRLWRRRTSWERLDASYED